MIQHPTGKKASGPGGCWGSVLFFICKKEDPELWPASGPDTLMSAFQSLGRQSYSLHCGSKTLQQKWHI